MEKNYSNWEVFRSYIFKCLRVEYWGNGEIRRRRKIIELNTLNVFKFYKV